MKPVDAAVFAEKMRAAGQSVEAVAQFTRGLDVVTRGGGVIIPEAEISSVSGLPELAGLAQDVEPSLLDQSVVIKLNGGLGTGMGLAGPKSLLEVREGQTFLSLILCQLKSLQSEHGSAVRTLLMNSFSTSEATMSYLAGMDGGAAVEEMIQSKVPKVLADDMTPAEWTVDPNLEWCPPGHGDIYATLVGSGKLDALLDDGVRYAFISNSDNLGATLDPQILTHFARSESPMMMEVTRRTPADRKGGHLAVRDSDGRLVLRESAQCAKTDEATFQDIDRHRYFNTNNLWLRLDVLKEVMEELNGLLALPVMANSKTLDPRDSSSPAVIQIETAMGGAIECFEGASAIVVDRSRFAPVKTTNDLLGLRSDAYHIDESGAVRLADSRQGNPPTIALDENHFKAVDGFERLFPHAAPSLIECDELRVDGAVTFAGGVVIAGRVQVTSPDEGQIAAGRYADETVIV